MTWSTFAMRPVITRNTRTVAGGRQPLASPEEVSEHYGVPLKTLYMWRHKGTGPRSAKIGRHVRYRWADVDAYFEAQSSVAA